MPGTRGIVAAAAASAAIYALLALAGDLRERLALYLGAFAALAALMLVALRLARGSRRGRRLALAAALLFRLVAAWGEPALSDDVYRYVWDGRVQLRGFHPYRYAPDDPALAGLRDASWSRVNHRELHTIYPPLAEALFLLLAACGAGPQGFRLFLGLADFGVVLALDHLLARTGLPRERLILYAWNPLAVLESAGSGHVEPVGVLLLVLAGAWIIDRRPWLSTIALGASVQLKLLPLVLVPGHARRAGPRAVALLALVLAVPWLPYALSGPPLGAGLAAYAARWEHNAGVYAVVERGLARADSGVRLQRALAAAQQRLGDWPLPWDWLYRNAWPRELARLATAAAALLWIAACLRRAREPPREFLLVLGGVLLLAPTLHPWYVLWVLPWAAACASPAWLALAATVSLAYWSGPGGDVPWAVRLVEFLPPLVLALAPRWRRFW